jgi:hypothetical protein
VRLTATNTTKKTAYLHFTSGQRFDFTVYNAGSNESVYTWSAARMFIQSLGSLTLKPGQSWSYNAEVSGEMGELKPGKYRLLARLTNTPRNITAAPIEFEIAPASLAMAARTDKTHYKIGEPVKVDISVANRSKTTNRVAFDSGMTFDVLITNSAEEPIWNYGANLRFIRVLSEVTWKKNETKNYSATWNGVPLPGELPASDLAPGRYKVQAILQSTPKLYAAPVFITIDE